MSAAVRLLFSRSAFEERFDGFGVLCLLAVEGEESLGVLLGKAVLHNN